MSTFPIVSPALLVLVGPFAVGKTTIIQKLLEFLKKFGFKKNITVTTRNPRPGEINGVDYFFVSRREFQKLVSSGEFIEHATVHGHRYGSLKKTIIHAIENGDRLILALDVQGHRSLRKHEHEGLNQALMSIFLTAPLEVLVKRALSRPGGMHPHELGKRVISTLDEFRCAKEDRFDIIVSNEDGEFDHNVHRIAHWTLERIKERDSFR